MSSTREEVLFALALEKPVEKRAALQSARGSEPDRPMSHSKTWRTSQWPPHSRSVLDCGSPLPLFPAPSWTKFAAVEGKE